ncbi:MAG: DNA/RNA nuclease SfsA [Candidatus Methanomethylophilaceae archaeon]|nr:DNA/RNA nuclease SfsA [Candidatus Methanomethylophilaceae archaeon]
MESISFPVPLTEGTIVKRTSIYTMDVSVNGETVQCHCPTTGRIGNIDLSGRPCLLSPSDNPKRKTGYTVEAISLGRPDDSDKRWIGINQNAANRYVEHYLRNGGFPDMVEGTEVRREVFLGESKLDFLVGDCYLEVKTPLQHLQVDIPDYVKTKKVTPFSSTDRMTRHMKELASSLESHQRAVMLIVFLYDNPGFRVVERSTNYEQVKATVEECVSKGVETWQANFRIDPEGVSLIEYFRIDVE